jgi:hypothetical protein
MLRLTLTTLLLLLASCSSLGSSESISFAEVLIRHELSVPTSYMASNLRQQPYFVAVEGKDLTSDSIRRLSDTGIEFRPGSDWRKGEGMQMSISSPTLRPDGDFDVIQSYYCHERCAASIASVMRHQGGNWTVISSELRSISRLDAPNNSFKPKLLRNSA